MNPRSRPPRPTPAQLLSAHNGRVPDLIRPGLDVLFCGINPSLYSAATGHHFARPGNRFWPALEAGGFTPRRLDPSEGQELLRLGCGISNVVDRATAAADELRADEYVEGGRQLVAKVADARPRAVAFLGIIAYRVAFGRPGASVGLQDQAIGEAAAWLLPNPSGLNAHYQLADLGALFAELRHWLDRSGGSLLRSESRSRPPEGSRHR